MERFVLVVLISLCSFTSAQEYVITRRIAVLDRHGTSHEQPDLVQIPSSLCRDNGTTECSLMDGQRHSICQCACDKTDKFHHYIKSTFGFYNKSWKCEENVAVHRHSGCLLSLHGHSGNEPVFTIPYDRETVGYFIVNATTDNYIPVAEGKTCSLTAERSTYMKCNGEWEQLNSTLVTKRFRVQVISDNQINFWVVSSASSSYRLPSGRIIRLAVTCSDRPWEPSQCLVVKVEGELKCPVLPSPPTSSSPLHPTLSSSEHSITSTPVHVSMITGPRTENIKKSRDGPTPAVAVISGSVVGGVVFIIVLVVIITLVLRLKRKRNERIMEETGIGTNGAENQVTGTDAETDSPLHRFPREEVMSNVDDNQEPGTTREIEPYDQFSKAEILNHQDNWVAGCKRESVPDYYQYPRVEMVPTKDNWVAGCKRETVPDYYQYPRVEMVPTKVADNSKTCSNRETVPDYQYPRVGMIPTKDNSETGPKRETVPDYQYPRVERVTSSESNNHPVFDRDDSPYETMNSLYQNIGNSRGELEHPYVNVNIC